MKRPIRMALIAPVLLLLHPALAFERPAPPQVLFGDLYADVELEPIFPDSKDFADATAKSPPPEILALYHAQKPNSPEGLKLFVVRHFGLPAQAATPAAVSEQVPIRRHIDALWTLLTRDEPTVAPYSSLLPLPRPYVVPGGRFSELYYWDSYFVMLGLAESRRRDLLEDMATNFADLMDTYGHAPNGTRTYYLSRSQPPFFFEMVSLLSPWDPAAAFARYLPELKTEYAYWMDGANDLKAGGAHRHAVALDDGSILNRYWDDSDAPRDESYREDVVLAAATPRPPGEIYRDIRAGAESGWDFSSRWFADARTKASIDTTEIIPVDLNAVMFGLENAIQRGLRTGRRSRLRRGLFQARRRASGGDRSLSLGSIPRRLSRLSLDEEAANRPRHRRNPLSAVHARRERSAGGVGGESRRGRIVEARRDRHDDARHRPAMGLAERVGAAAMDRGRRADQLWAQPARRNDRLPVDGHCLARLSLRPANWWKNTT